MGWGGVASFPDLPSLQFLIACSSQKQRRRPRESYHVICGTHDVTGSRHEDLITFISPATEKLEKQRQVLESRERSGNEARRIFESFDISLENAPASPASPASHAVNLAQFMSACSGSVMPLLPCAYLCNNNK